MIYRSELNNFYKYFNILKPLAKARDPQLTHSGNKYDPLSNIEIKTKQDITKSGGDKKIYFV